MAKYEDKKWFLAVLGSVLGLGIILLAHYGNPGVFCKFEIHSIAAKSTQCCHPIFSF